MVSALLLVGLSVALSVSRVPEVANVQTTDAGGFVCHVERAGCRVMYFREGSIWEAAVDPNNSIAFQQVVVSDEAISEGCVIGLHLIAVAGTKTVGRVGNVSPTDLTDRQAAGLEQRGVSRSIAILPVGFAPPLQPEDRIDWSEFLAHIGVSDCSYYSLPGLDRIQADIASGNSCAKVGNESIMGSGRRLLFRNGLRLGSCGEIGIRLDQFVGLNLGALHFEQLPIQRAGLFGQNIPLVKSSTRGEEEANYRQPFAPYLPLLGALILFGIAALFIRIGLRDRSGARGAFFILCGFPFFLCGLFIVLNLLIGQ